VAATGDPGSLAPDFEIIAGNPPPANSVVFDPRNSPCDRAYVHGFVRERSQEMDPAIRLRGITKTFGRTGSATSPKNAVSIAR
jgi:hypothetical protein